MDDKEYWETRARQMELMGEKSADELLQTMKPVYKNSLAEINKEIEAFYGRYAENNNLSLDEVHKRLNPKELKSAKEEIKRYYDAVDRLARDKDGRVDVNLLRQYKDELRLLSARAYMSRLEELKLGLKNITVHLGVEESEAYYQTLSKIYGDIYKKTNFDIDKFLGFSTGFEGLNYKKLNSAIHQPWLGMNFSDRIWKNKGKLLEQINTTFLQGVAQGFNPKKITGIMYPELKNSISKDFKNAYYACERLARTECAHIAGEATLQGYKDNEIEKYKFDATLDDRTSDICQSLDGTIHDVKEAQAGVNYPPMHPNCRSTTIPYFKPDDIDKMFDEAQRVARDENGELYYVPASMTYKEWEKTVTHAPPMSINNVVNTLKNEKAEYYLFNDSGDTEDLEISDDYHKFFLPKSVRNNFDKIENIKTFNDLKSYLHSNGIELTTDLSKLKGEDANKEISAVKEASQKIAVAIDTYKTVFGKDSIYKLKRINLYDNELPNTASYNYNRIGENDKLAGTIQIRDWTFTGRDIFHELAHAYQDSNARKGEDALSFSDRVVKENDIKFKSIYRVLGEAKNAEMLAEAISQGFTKNRSDGREIIMKLRKYNTK